MKNRVCLSLCVILMALLSSVLTPRSGLAAPISVEATQDILYMSDGRILHGRIISENDLEVVFEYTHKALGITTKLILQMENISKIERDIAMDTPEQLDEDTENEEVGELPESQIENDQSQLSKLISKYGASLSSDSPDLTSVYIVPMRGQMGTDVHPSIYRKIADDIKATNPDLIIIAMDSSDSKTDEFFGSVPKDEQSILLMDEYLEIANIFRVELKDFPQVLWINTSVGLSSMLALAWSDMYMKPSGKFAGLDLVVDKSGADKWSDADVRAKMMAAWTGNAKSFAEYGGYPMELCVAMLEPQYKLSAAFKGREVVWSLNGVGQYLVDGSTEKTVSFTARDAENLCFCDGLAETLDDLALLLGYREYRLVGANGTTIHNNYIKNWRRSFQTAKRAMEDYQKHMSRASGEQTVRWLGRAKGDLKKVIAAINRYEAVAIRMGTDFGIVKDSLEIEIEQMNERLRSLRNSGRAAGAGGQSGGGGNAPRGGRGGSL